MRRTKPSVSALLSGIMSGNRALIGRALTLVESNHKQDRLQSAELLTRLLPQTGNALRVGITGAPGVGKSTFIETLGKKLLKEGRSVAVLAVDPTSTISGGSILGDKTRMNYLSTHPNAFVRPSPTSKSLGGVARKTRESILIFEAAGYDVILVETVGVGQSEVEVSAMVDTFLVLMIAGAGDELQGIKRGILELADIVAVNKADGENKLSVGLAVEQYKRALHYVSHRLEGWQQPVIAISAIHKKGISELWNIIKRHREVLSRKNGLSHLRANQRLAWMWQMIEQHVYESIRSHPKVKQIQEHICEQVENGDLSATLGAQRILSAFNLR